MDPTSIIFMALVTGAAAALKPTTEQAVKDAYTGIKHLILDRYRSVSVTMLEVDPANKSRQDVIKQDLEKTTAGQDEELLREAKSLLDAVQAHASDAAKAVGVDLEDIKGATLRIDSILAEGTDATGLKAKQLNISGDIEIKGVTARNRGDVPPKKS